MQDTHGRLSPLFFLLCFITIATITMSSTFVAAHVGYVLTKEEFQEAKGQDMQFLNQAMTVTYILLAIITLIFSVGLYFLVPKIPFVKKKLLAMEQRLESYEEFLPWIARLGVGIALIGAGSSSVLVSPTLPASMFGTAQIFLGFLLLAGLATPIAALGVVVIYFIALTHSSYLIGNLDLLTLTIAIIILGNGRPGLDDIFSFTTINFEKCKKYTPLVLRLGIGIAMCYLAVYEKLLNPHTSALVVQNFNLMNVIPVSTPMWVTAAGIVELAVGLALLVGFRTRLFSAIAFLVISLSFFYFGEQVYSHITLFATLSALFITGSGKWSIDALITPKVKNTK